MSVIEQTFGSSSAPSSNTLPLLTELPKLLEYRAHADPDSEFIPKTVAGFGMGAVAMFICLELAEAVLINRRLGLMEQMPTMVRNFAFMLGITGVGASLLLVGLKVRADHVAEQLYSRHWLNSIGTGAAFAVLAWGPWLFTSHFGMAINRFVAAGICMLLLTFPAIAARWTIAPHSDHSRAL